MKKSIKLKQILVEIGAVDAAPPPPHVQNVYSELKKIIKYQAYDLQNSCVVNCVIFESWFRDNFPNNWIRLLMLPPIDKEKTGHEVVIFELGNSLFAWDIRYGVLSLPGATKSESVLIAAVRDSFKNTNSQSKLKFRSLGSGEEVFELQKDIKRIHPAIVAKYDGTNYLVFITETQNKKRMHLFHPDRGTQSCEFTSQYSANYILQYMFSNIFGGNGKFSTKDKDFDNQ